MAARTIQKVYEILPTLNLERFEVIAVDDGSKDKTGEILDGLAKRYAHLSVIHHSPNRGYGGALKSGLYNSRYEWIFFSDGDLQFDLAEISKLTEKSSQADLIIGYRCNRAEGLIRHLNTFLYGFLIRFLFGLEVKDIDCAFKLIRKKAIETIPPLESEGALISAELLIKAKKTGFKIIEVPVSHYPDLAGGSTGAKMSVILRMFREVFRLFRKLR